MDHFDQNVLNIIEKFSYKFFIVQLNQEVKCICLSEGSSQPDPNCKKCLGTGHKIKIKKIEGASQESNIPDTFRTGNKFIIAKNYYIKSNTDMNIDDLIVDNNQVWSIYQNSDKTSFHGNKVYQKCSTVPKKCDVKLFMKNFNKIVGR